MSDSMSRREMETTQTDSVRTLSLDASLNLGDRFEG
jgi:hypothetical protein